MESALMIQSSSKQGESICNNIRNGKCHRVHEDTEQPEAKSSTDCVHLINEVLSLVVVPDIETIRCPSSKGRSIMLLVVGEVDDQDFSNHIAQINEFVRIEQRIEDKAQAIKHNTWINEGETNHGCLQSHVQDCPTEDTPVPDSP